MAAAFGSYEVEAELGRGAQGRVYRVRQRATGAVRALKVLEGSLDPESLVRFRREAETLARASGPGVVAVHEAGASPRGLWFVMDLMPGGSLRDRVRAAGALEWREAAGLVARLARALERCHALGVVHRDLKPENVLFDDTGEPRLADFGCVRDAAGARLTQTGALLGTPLYMAPEQLEGLRVEAAADVFALGLILHELAAGRHPRQGKTFVELVADARREVVPPLSSTSGVPDDLDALLARALARDPRERCSARELAAGLEALVAGGAPPVPAPRPHRVPAAALVLAAGLALAGTGALTVAGIGAWRAGAGHGVTGRPNPLAPSAGTHGRSSEEAALERLASAANLPVAATVTSERVPLETLDLVAGLEHEPFDLARVASRAVVYPVAAIERLRARHPACGPLRVLAACGALATGDESLRASAAPVLAAAPPADASRAGSLGAAIRAIDAIVAVVGSATALDVDFGGSPCLTTATERGRDLEEALARAHLPAEELRVVLAPLAALAREQARSRQYQDSGIETDQEAEPRRSVFHTALAALAPDRFSPALYAAWVASYDTVEFLRPSLATQRPFLAQRLGVVAPELEARDPLLASAAWIRWATVSWGGELVGKGPARPIPELLARLDAVPELLARDTRPEDVSWRAVVEHDRLLARGTLEYHLGAPGAPDAARHLARSFDDGLEAFRLGERAGFSSRKLGSGARLLLVEALEGRNPGVPDDIVARTSRSDPLRAELVRLRGDPAGALVHLERHEAPSFASENTVHAIRALALAALGKRDEARREVGRIDASHAIELMRFAPDQVRREVDGS